jgi:hypothetical protein
MGELDEILKTDPSTTKPINIELERSHQYATNDNKIGIHSTKIKGTNSKKHLRKNKGLSGVSSSKQISSPKFGQSPNPRGIESITIDDMSIQDLQTQDGLNFSPSNATLNNKSVIQGG